MPVRAIVFDVIETLFSLEPLRDRLVAEGWPPSSLEVFFAGTLRDAFAMDTAGIFNSFRDVAGSRLTAMGLGDGARDRVLGGFTELPAQDHVADAFDRAHAAGVPMYALTNGDAEVTRTLLGRAGLAHRIERVMSIDEIGRWKPARQVYDHAVSVAGIPASEVALVAAHGWDIAGARQAGLVGAYVDRGEGFPAVMPSPEIVAGDVDAAVEALVS